MNKVEDCWITVVPAECLTWASPGAYKLAPWYLILGGYPGELGDGEPNGSLQQMQAPRLVSIQLLLDSVLRAPGESMLSKGHFNKDEHPFS